MFDIATLIQAFFLTWVVGLSPALVARYVWKKVPLSGWLATTIAAVSCVIFAIGLMFVRLATGGEGGISPAWMLVFLVSRAIMMRKRSRAELMRLLREMIADPVTSPHRRVWAQDSLKRLELGGAAEPGTSAQIPEGSASRTEVVPNLQIADGALDADSTELDEHVDPFEQLSIAGLSAISVFAEQECAAMAARVRYDLRREPATGIFGDDHGHRTLWDEYRFEVLHGPTIGLEHAWSEVLHPYIAERIAALEHPTAVLLTIAAEYASEDFGHQNGRTRNDDQIRNGVRNALCRLALSARRPMRRNLLMQTEAYLDRLASRVATLMRTLPRDEWKPMMRELSRSAWEGGLTTKPPSPDPTDPEQWAMDLLMGMDAGVAQTKRQDEYWPRTPAMFETLDEIASAFLPPSSLD